MVPGGEGDADPPARGRLLTLLLTALAATALDRVLANDWITTAALSFLGVGIISHVAVGLRWPFALLKISYPERVVLTPGGDQ